MTGTDTTFSEAIEKVMLNNEYYAPLQLIYKEFEKYRPFSGLTPLQTIQERVQRDKRFTRIGFGVYALTEFLNKLPHVIEPKTKVENANYNHTRIQGMIIEIGNMDGFDTYTPDKTKVFDNKVLGNLVTIREMPNFTYEKIIAAIKYIDVVWFNARGFPEKLFEVEDSTDFRSSLVKFAELQDFRVAFRLVASIKRKTKYDREVVKTAFNAIIDRCSFVSYDSIENLYTSTLNYQKVQTLSQL